MITGGQYLEIKELKAEGLSVRAIARQTGLARNTVRKVLRGEHLLKVQAGPRASKLDPFKTYLKERFGQYQLSAVRLLAEIQPMGYTGSVVTIRRYLQTLKGPEQRLRRLTVRYETPPGQQGQVDWADCGRFQLPAGSWITVSVFVMVLSYSRMLFVRFTTSTKLAELLRCHQQAFEYFGGWPEMILYDNMKQVRLSRSLWNEAFLDFAHYYGFVPKTHRPYRPQTKGKVERAVEYVKDNFLAGRTFESLEQLNTQAVGWLEGTANSRVHGTTGAVPRERFPQETLIPLQSIPPYHITLPVTRTVSRDAMVQYQGSRYSVPPSLAGHTVRVAAQGGAIVVRCGETVMAEHQQALRPGQCIVDKTHLADLWKLTLAQLEVPPAPSGVRWHLAFEQTVDQCPLTCFEEVSA